MCNDELLGVFPEMSNEDYHGHEGSYSRSALMEYKRSPYHFWSHYLNPSRQPKKTTKALWFGDAFHTYILEPHLFDGKFAIKPFDVKLKDVGKEAFQIYKDALSSLKDSNKRILNDADAVSLNGMKEAVFSNENAKNMLSGAVFEQSYFWKDEDSGLIIKCRPDILNGKYLIDLKSAEDASPEEFSRSLGKYGYHIQAAMMIDGMKAVEGIDIDGFYFIVVEKSYPFAIGIYLIDDESIEAGRKEYKRLLLGIKDSVEKNVWADYDVQVVGLPQWYINKMNEGEF